MIKKDDIRRILKANQNNTISTKAFKAKDKLKISANARIISLKPKTKIESKGAFVKSAKSIRHFKDKVYRIKENKISKDSISKSHNKLKMKAVLKSSKSRDSSSCKTKFKAYEGSKELTNLLTEDKVQVSYMSNKRYGTTISRGIKRRNKNKTCRKSAIFVDSSNMIPKALVDKLAGVLETSTRPVSKASKRNTDASSIPLPERSHTFTPGNNNSSFKNKSTAASSNKVTPTDCIQKSLQRTYSNAHGTELASLGSKIKTVLQGYQQREKMLVKRCQYLEAELKKYKGSA